MVNTVAVYGNSTIVGYKLRKYCDCCCHKIPGVLHFVACCTEVKGFDDFPELDEYGTPKEKLPNCPSCDEDELGVISPTMMMCYKCGWRMVRGSAAGFTT